MTAPPADEQRSANPADASSDRAQGSAQTVFDPSDIEAAARQVLTGYRITPADAVACDCCGRSLWDGDEIEVRIRRPSDQLAWELIGRFCLTCEDTTNTQAGTVEAVGTAQLAERHINASTEELVLEAISVIEISFVRSDHRGDSP